MTDVAGAPRQKPLEWQERLPGGFAVAPPELLVVCALMAVAGVLTLWPVLRALPDTFRLFGDGPLGRDIGLLLLAVWTLLGAFGVACLVLSWRLGHADRVGRGLAYVLLGGLGASILIGDVHDTQLTLVWLACFASIAILAFAPRVRDYFAGPHARQHDLPTSVVVARTLLATWAFCVSVVGVMFLPLGDLASRFVVVGVLFVLLAAGAFAANKALGAGSSTARLWVTAGAVVDVVLTLIVSRRDPSMLLQLSLSVAIVIFLWGPADAQEFFGPAPTWLSDRSS